MTQDRVTDLEIQIAHQARQIDELDEVVRRQAEALEVLERKMRAVIARIAEAQEDAPGAVMLGDQKPPHY